MIYNQSIRLQVIFRIALIISFSLAILYFILFTNFWLLSLWAALFTILSIIELIRFIERDRRALESFLISINQNDFMGNVGISRDQEFLQKIFKSLSDKYHKIASEKETNHHFLNAVVEHAGVPMIAFEESKEEIRLINNGAKELFNRQYFKKLDSLAKLDKQLVSIIKTLENGSNELYRFESNTGWKELSIVAKSIQLQGENYKLIALHNIKKELDKKESESWQKLIKVMTHEIKNSVIPISTLSEVLEQMIVSEKGTEFPLVELNKEDEEDLRIGIKTIAKRSKGLVTFVNAYGQIAKIPSPKPINCSLNDLMKHVYELYKPIFLKTKKLIEIQIPDSHLHTMIDPDLFEQVLINLIKNGFEATEANGKVVMKLNSTQNHYQISVIDNGSGISNDILQDIFTPFFTTKEQGSGIGLSLSRQIIRQHAGELEVKSEMGFGTTFTIIIPKRVIN